MLRAKEKERKKEKHTYTLIDTVSSGSLCCHSLKVLNNHFLGQMPSLFIKIKTIFIIYNYINYILYNLTYIFIL